MNPSVCRISWCGGSWYSFKLPVAGVASIGQVHKAVLKKNGAVVAVKLQLPGMEHMFRSDVQTLKTFCQLALPQHVSAFSEIEKQFLTGTSNGFNSTDTVVLIFYVVQSLTIAGRRRTLLRSTIS